MRQLPPGGAFWGQVFGDGAEGANIRRRDSPKNKPDEDGAGARASVG